MVSPKGNSPKGVQLPVVSGQWSVVRVSPEGNSPKGETVASHYSEGNI